MKHLAFVLLLFFSLAGMGQGTVPHTLPNQPKQTVLLNADLINDISKAPATDEDWVLRTKPDSSPIWIIDSVKVPASSVNYINPNEIANLNILKNAQYPDGAICITLKDHSLFLKLFQSPLLSLADISRTHIDQSRANNPVLYILDDKLLTDTTAVRIPSVCITKVIVINAAETPYFKTTLPNVLLMMISTAQLSKKREPTEIRIRGAISSN